jgi:hypothetical protein
MKFDEILEACWKGYHKEGMKTMFGKRYPNCVKNKKKNNEDMEPDLEEGKRIARKPGQPAGSKKHSDLYTDENPRGTITGLKFATVKDARASVSKIRNSGRSHAHKIQAAVAMEQRARAAGKASAAAVYRRYINANKRTDEGLQQEITERCWTGYAQQGMKKKGDRMVPNCVPVAEDHTPDHTTAMSLAQDLNTMMADVAEIRHAGEASTNLNYLRELQRRIGVTEKQIRNLGFKYDVNHPNLVRPLGRPLSEIESIEEATDPFLDNAARELLALAFMAGVPFAIAAYQRVRNSLDRYRGQQIIQALIKRGVKMDRETYLETRPILDEFEDAVEANDGARASALAQRIEQMIVMGKLREKEPQAADDALTARERELQENLKQWFKQKWVRFGPDGKIRGDCARGSSKEGKPKCLPQAKAQALGKKGRASAAAKKRREDPDPERRGAAKNVATKVREAGSPAQQSAIAIAMKQAGKQPKSVAEGIPFDQCPGCGGAIVHISMLQEKQDACYHKVKSRYKVWPSAYASGALVQCRKKGAANWGTGAKKK